MRCSRVCTWWCRRRAATTPVVDETALESELAALARAWPDELRDALVAARGEEAGVDTFRIWRDAFPPGYQADVTPEQAVADIAVLEAGDDLAIRLQSGPDGDGVARLKLYRSGAPLLLSDVMPVLEHLDVIVVDERPYAITAAGGAPRCIYSFGVRAASGDALGRPRCASAGLGAVPRCVGGRDRERRAQSPRAPRGARPRARSSCCARW